MESFSTTLGQKAACFRGRTGRPARGEPSRASNRGGPGSPGPWSRRWCSAQMVARAGSLCGSERAPRFAVGELVRVSLDVVGLLHALSCVHVARGPRLHSCMHCRHPTPSLVSSCQPLH